MKVNVKLMYKMKDFHLLMKSEGFALKIMFAILF